MRGAAAWRRGASYLERGLWLSIPESRGRRLGARLLRIVLVVARGAQDPLLNLEAMGLVYSTLLSLVPFLAVAFSVLKAFGVHYRMEPLLARMLEPLGPAGVEITSRVIGFVGNMNVGVLGALGLAMLFYTVVSLVQKVEDALNRIWRVRRTRPLVRRFSDYLSILLVGPVLVFAAFAIIASIQSHAVVQRVLASTPLAAPALGLIANVMPLVLLAAAFTFLYRFMPYTHVRLTAAAVGGVTGAILWHLAGMAFTALVAGSATYAGVYSSFAVLMLSLIWLQVAWLVVLIGGHVAHVHQHPVAYVMARAEPSVGARERVALSALLEITRRHVAGDPPCRTEHLARMIGAPLSMLDDLVDVLVARGILARSSEPRGVVIARAPERVRVVEILDAVHDPASSLALRPADEAIERVLGLRDRAVHEAIGPMTLATLAAAAPGEPGVADLEVYRRRSGAS
jgi:membrane protein